MKSRPLLFALCAALASCGDSSSDSDDGVVYRTTFGYFLTTGDSSLSASVQAIVAAELGYREKAVQYAWYGALMDLADVAGNVRDGCHIASMGGTWMAVVYGLAGLHDWDGQISFRPRVPPRVEGIRFPLTIRGQVLEIDIHRKAVTYRLREGDGLTFRHEEEEIHLSPEHPVAVRPRPAPKRA